MKTLNARQLPQDRLSTTDEKGRRLYIHPADVQGHFKKWRSIIHAFMILFFLALPWVRVGGNPAILLDISQRRFTILGATFWAHDAPILLFIFVGAALALGFITAIWGRIWCGWACPQTVFIEGVFRRIERWVEGDSLARKKIDREKMNPDKLLKKIFKWALFILVSLVITHSFLAYFVGSEKLFHMIQASPLENPSSFLLMAATTLAILFNFGWFREQFCTIACPYGRFQSVLLDNHSLVICYDASRGEPRGKQGEARGDCIDCFRCVDVCPTGIDIRRGLQMECIACTACIDACDTVMEKIERPKGLIRYDSLAGLQKRVSKKINVRTLTYLFLLSVVIVGFSLTLYFRKDLEISFVRSKEAPYQQMSGSSDKVLILNHYKVHLENKSFENLNLNFSLESAYENLGIELVTALRPLPLASGKNVQADLFVKFPKSLLKNGQTKIKINITSSENKEINRKEELTLVGPYF